MFNRILCKMIGHRWVMFVHRDQFVCVRCLEHN